MGNVEVRKNKEGYELNLNTLIYSDAAAGGGVGEGGAGFAPY